MTATAATWRALAGIAVPAGLTALMVRTRSDYLGHLLAGFSGTLLALALVAWRRVRLGWDVVAIVVVAIVFGTFTELTVFRLAIFDTIDFALQSVGAVVAGASVVGRVGSARSAAGFVAAGVVGLVIGFRFAFA